jgi:hypothetical protein
MDTTIHLITSSRIYSCLPLRPLAESMSGMKTLTLYKPDGTTQTFHNVLSAYKNEKGVVYIQPSDEDETQWGKSIQTDLPFMLTDTD